MRILITGGPRTGKTTLGQRWAEERGIPVYHTDDVMRLGWSEASEEVSTWFDRPGSWIIEGVAVPRAMRKWYERHPEGQPADELYVLERTDPKDRTRKLGQDSMAKGVRTVLDGLGRSWPIERTVSPTELPLWR